MPFRYKDKGTMATIGRRSAVVQLGHGLRITGTLAWLAWLALHLFYLLGGRNRISTLINLTSRYLAWGHGGGVIVGDSPVVGLMQTPPPDRDEAGQRSVPRQSPASQTAGARVADGRRGT